MEKTLENILREQLQLKGISIQKLRQHTGIADRYLHALLEGKHEKLPPAPYTRGYLMKIATALDLNGEELWNLYKNGSGVKSSGPLDRLPGNRFALKKINKGWMIGGIVGIVIIFYVIVNAGRFVGTPSLTITNPKEATTIVNEDTILLTGTINPNDKLIIGGEEVTPNTEGSFEYPYKLEVGLNQIEFSVKKFLGKERKEIKQVVYEVKPEPTPIP